jgi:hypothetical protein
MNFAFYSFENDEIIYSGNAKNNQPINENTIFECASLTKIIMAYIGLKYVVGGQLDLNKSITEYLTESELNILNFSINRNSRYRDILIKMLFSHTSGIPDRAGILYSRLQFPPGTNFTYSGEGFYLLQKIVEKIENKSIDKIFKKFFNLPNCSFKYEELFEPNMATPFDTMINPHGAQSFYSSMDSLVKIMKQIINDKDTFPLMKTSQFNMSSKIGIGLGPFIVNNNTLWQWGDKKNFKNFFYYNFVDKTGFISLSNSVNGWNYIKPHIDTNVINFLRSIYFYNYI